MLLGVDICTETIETWRILGFFIFVLKILVPIIIVIMATKDLFNILLKGDYDSFKGTASKIFRRIVAGIIVFMVPSILFAIINLFVNNDFEELYDFAGCTSCLFSPRSDECENHVMIHKLQIDEEAIDFEDNVLGSGNLNTDELEMAMGGGKYTGRGMGGRALKIHIDRNVKDPEGRCGTYSADYCAEIATVEYPSGTVKYYMGYQNNTKLLGGSCRALAFTSGMNATTNSKYSALDLQKYLASEFGDEGVFRARKRFEAAINHFNVPAKAYFGETSIADSIQLAGAALDNGQPVIIFVAHDKCPDLAGTHHALMLVGYDEKGNVIFLDSCGLYFGAKKRNLQELGACMSSDGTANNWMRMVIFSF